MMNPLTLATLAPARAAAVTARSSYRVEVVEDFDSFLRLEQDWNDLLERSGLSFPFVTHEWVRTWIEHFGAEQRLHMLVVRRGGTVAAILPLMISRGLMYGVPVLRLQSIHNVYTERFDFLVDGPNEEIYQAIWDHLLHGAPRWDVLELRQLPSGSPTLSHLTRLAARDRRPTERWHASDSPYVPIRGTFQSYSRTLDRKHRANLRNRLGRLSRVGRIEIEIIKTAGEAETALAAGWRLEAAAWKGRAGTAIGCLPRVRSFYESFAARAARRGWLCLYFLRVNGQRIAFCYGLCFANRVFQLKPGYDPGFASLSPSTTLTAMILEEAFDRGREELDFLGVNDAWKQSWSTTTRSHEWLFVFRPGLRSHLLRWAKFRIAPALRRARWQS